MDVYNQFKIRYENNASVSLIVIDMDDKAALMNYQLEMIARNSNHNIILPDVRFINDRYCAYYDITSKIPIASYFKRNSINRSNLIEILSSITHTVVGSRKLLLNSNGFLIDENYIYIDPGTKEISMVYLPFEIDTNVDDAVKSFVLKVILKLANIDEEHSDNYIQKVINCVKSETFKTIELDKLLNNLNEKKSDTGTEFGNAASKIEIQGFANKAVQKSIKPDTVSYGKRMVYRRTTLVIAFLVQVVGISLLALLIQYLRPNGNYFDALPELSGGILIFGALDFLVLRKLLNKENMEEVELIDVPPKPDVKKEISWSQKKDPVKLLENSIDEKNNNKKKPVFKDYAFELERKQVSPEMNLKTVLLDTEIQAKYPSLICVGSNGDEKILITKDSFLIGRLKGQVDHEINNNAVGRIHIELTSREGKYFVKDLNSKNGTRINGIRITSNTEHEIINNDTISIANCQYRFAE